MQRIYRGRFAPSPTGPLHFGSLVAALASYLDAKKHNGEWLIRIEDVDGSRCKKEHAQSLISALSSYGLLSDLPILKQSTRFELYENTLQSLNTQKKVFPCHCTRQSLKTYQGRHPHICSPNISNTEKPSSEHSWRLLTNQKAIFEVNDPIQGHLLFDAEKLQNNPILKRKDGFFSYQLAVVVDDHAQEITHLVRGSDLLDTTTEQLYLYSILDWEPPSMCHIPVILDSNGNKVSKQNHAKALLAGDKLTLLTALKYLQITNISPALHIQEILQLAIKKWNPEKIQQSKSIQLKPEDCWLIQ
ncbi:tRNA glutamyl-Q(34) synthetase GluQRS [Marinomonas balearica]|uniref:Glutamyl-Q tRNA(Asp) synthetase n=1 Tax=Marinomonas balearica TaxID=491947 RepID=A0A4R6M2P2_9GAMM|nr:tRNA glutamyl-Q(34) synthetase GluQRS [Marinomonas balearica]TDO95483.1 glutamyl-Q tRNA(Asp) synthetase [Marinomonas balearica]